MISWYVKFGNEQIALCTAANIKQMFSVIDEFSDPYSVSYISVKTGAAICLQEITRRTDNDIEWDLSFEPEATDEVISIAVNSGDVKWKSATQFTKRRDENGVFWYLE